MYWYITSILKNRKNNFKESYIEQEIFLTCVWWVCVHMFSCCTCMNTHLWGHMYTHLHVCACGSQKLTSLGAFPNYSPQYLLKQGSKDLSNLPSLLWESQSLTHECWDDKWLTHLLCRFWGSRIRSPHLYTKCFIQHVIFPVKSQISVTHNSSVFELLWAWRS